MRDTRPLLVIAPVVLLASLFLVGATCGPNEAHRRRISGVHVAGPVVDAGTPPPPEGFLPRHVSSGDRYHRTDVVTTTIDEHNTSVRIERDVTVESVGTDGVILMSERVHEVHMGSDGRESPPPRELRDVAQPVARYRVNVHGELQGDVDVLGGTPATTAFVHDNTLRGLTQAVFDKSRDMLANDRRTAERTFPIELEGVQPNVALQMTYTLSSMTDREAQFQLDGAGEISETPLAAVRGHSNRLRGSANLNGTMTIDPRDGFAGTFRTELHLFYTIRDEQNRPTGPAKNVLVTTETTISLAH
jgi:hypothetical protein